MNALDFIIIGFMLLMTVIGYYRGFFVELFMILKWLLALVLAFVFYKPVGAVMLTLYRGMGLTLGADIPGIQIIERFVANVFAFILIWIGFRILAGLFIKALGFINEIPLIGFIHRLGGAVIGFAKGYLIVFLSSLILYLPVFQSDLALDSVLLGKVSEETPLFSERLMANEALMGGIESIVEDPSNLSELPSLLSEIIESSDFEWTDMIRTFDSKTVLYLMEQGIIPKEKLFDFLMNDSNEQVISHLMEDGIIEIQTLLDYLESLDLSDSELEELVKKLGE